MSPVDRRHEWRVVVPVPGVHPASLLQEPGNDVQAALAGCHMHGGPLVVVASVEVGVVGLQRLEFVQVADVDGGADEGGEQDLSQDAHLLPRGQVHRLGHLLDEVELLRRLIGVNLVLVRFGYETIYYRIMPTWIVISPQIDSSIFFLFSSWLQSTLART